MTDSRTVALFGATGGTGRQVLARALDRGLKVRALVRDPARLPALRPEQRETLTVVTGDVLERAPVDECIAGSDAAICILGTRPGAQPIEDAGTRVILESMQAQGVRRLIAVTSMGIGDSRDQLGFAARAMFFLLLRRIMAAKERQEADIRASGLDWTIVRPGGLTDDPPTGDYRAGTDKTIVARRISRADVADFVLKQLDDEGYLHQAPSVT